MDCAADTFRMFHWFGRKMDKYDQELWWGNKTEYTHRAAAENASCLTDKGVSVKIC
jgi:hypothetical protein